jgi:hypothetical protein
MMPTRARDAEEKLKEWCDYQDVKRKQSQQQRPGLSKRALWGCILSLEAKQRCADQTMTGACKKEWLTAQRSASDALSALFHYELNCRQA